MARIRELHIIALASHGEGISGGDRIYIEFARRWSKQFPVIIYSWNEGRRMCERQNLEGKYLSFKIIKIPFGQFNFLISYISRIIQGIKLGVSLKLKNQQDIYIYNASEFWMDSLATYILKLRYPKIYWIASWYQTAPNPLLGFTDSKRENKHKLRALLYYLVQFPIKYLVKAKADKVFVNNDNERKEFEELDKKGKALVVIGAVPLTEIRKYKLKNKNSQKEYEAVFQGRFNAQKGVVELIEIWKRVVSKKPKARLVMIGDGYLMQEVKDKIRKLGLENNIKLTGFLFDGDKKFDFFNKSRLVLHPAFFDSGGMAAAEAMAFGLPAVGFDLSSFESYYPKGMVKSKKGDLKDFSNYILKLLDDKKFYDKIQKEAINLIETNYSWDKRANEILYQI